MLNIAIKRIFYRGTNKSSICKPYILNISFLHRVWFLFDVWNVKTWNKLIFFICDLKKKRYSTLLCIKNLIKTFLSKIPNLTKNAWQKKLNKNNIWNTDKKCFPFFVSVSNTIFVGRTNLKQTFAVMTKIRFLS